MAVFPWWGRHNCNCCLEECVVLVVEERFQFLCMCCKLASTLQSRPSLPNTGIIGSHHGTQFCHQCCLQTVSLVQLGLSSYDPPASTSKVLRSQVWPLCPTTFSEWHELEKLDSRAQMWFVCSALSLRIRVRGFYLWGQTRPVCRALSLPTTPLSFLPYFLWQRQRASIFVLLHGIHAGANRAMSMRTKHYFLVPSL